MQRVPDVPWRGVVVDGRLYSKDGAIAYRHVRNGAGPADLARLMGKPAWARMWHYYAAHVAEGPRVQAGHAGLCFFGAVAFYISHATTL
jgi:hypothetical protein